MPCYSRAASGPWAPGEPMLKMRWLLRAARMVAMLVCFWASHQPLSAEARPKPPRARTSRLPSKSSIPKKPGVAKIDRICDRLIFLTEKALPRRFALIRTDDQTGKTTWQAFEEEETLAAAIDQGRVSLVAEVWKDRSGALAVTTTLTTPTGAWARFVDYCFRPNGTLARALSTFNRFSGKEDDGRGNPTGSSRERIRHFSEAGQQIAERSRLFDLRSGRAVRADEPMTEEEPIYRRIKELPFYGLMSKR